METPRKIFHEIPREWNATWAKTWKFNEDSMGYYVKYSMFIRLPSFGHYRIVAIGSTIAQRARDAPCQAQVTLKWAVRVITNFHDDRCCWLTPRIPKPAHRRGRVPPWWMDTNFRRRLLDRLNKKLIYRIGTARHAMLVNSCYVSRAMEFIKVSNSKSDLLGHWKGLAHTVSY